jgi:hypothetical protein
MRSPKCAVGDLNLTPETISRGRDSLGHPIQYPLLIESDRPATQSQSPENNLNNPKAVLREILAYTTIPTLGGPRANHELRKRDKRGRAEHVMLTTYARRLNPQVSEGSRGTTGGHIMKNLKKLKVAELRTANTDKAANSLTKKQRATLETELEAVKYILTGYPQGADGERTPTGGCPCGGCYKSDEQMRDAVTAFSNLVDKYGYDVIRNYSFVSNLFEGEYILALLLTVYLNLPDAAKTKTATA